MLKRSNNLGHRLYRGALSLARDRRSGYGSVKYAFRKRALRRRNHAGKWSITVTVGGC